jgi:hypothetical protein
MFAVSFISTLFVVPMILAMFCLIERLYDKEPTKQIRKLNTKEVPPTSSDGELNENKAA